MAMHNYKINELANEFNITTRSIRFYEDKGMLHPVRKGQTRLYNESDRVRLKLIMRGKRLGLSLEESKQLIDMYQPQGANQKQLEKLLEKIGERRIALKQQLLDIKAMQLELDEAEARCLNSLQRLCNESNSE